MLDGVRRVRLMLDTAGLPPVRSSARSERHRRTCASRNSGGDRSAQHLHADVDATRIGVAVVDIENVHERRCVRFRSAPPRPPGQEFITSKRDLHPFRPPASVNKVTRQLLVEDVGQSGEEAEFVAPGERTHRDVAKVGHGTPRPSTSDHDAQAARPSHPGA
jgi:hypothetical protein